MFLEAMVLQSSATGEGFATRMVGCVTAMVMTG
ncbi:MAG: hypothetical protein QOJ66_2739 [Ilumatobacteraceae bacterium]